MDLETINNWDKADIFIDRDKEVIYVKAKKKTDSNFMSGLLNVLKSQRDFLSLSEYELNIEKNE